MRGAYCIVQALSLLILLKFFPLIHITPLMFLIVLFLASCIDLQRTPRHIMTFFFQSILYKASGVIRDTLVLLFVILLDVFSSTRDKRLTIGELAFCLVQSVNIVRMVFLPTPSVKAPICFLLYIVFYALIAMLFILLYVKSVISVMLVKLPVPCAFVFPNICVIFVIAKPRLCLSTLMTVAALLTSALQHLSALPTAQSDDARRHAGSNGCVHACLTA